MAILPGISARAAHRGQSDGSFDTITFGSNSAPAPNAFEFDKHGNLYVSDSFQGAIFLIKDVIHCKHTCAVTTLSHDPLLATAGFPPFGANGLAFNGDNSALFIANTGDDRVLKLDMASKVVSVFAESINGADGIVFDRQGRLWVAANQNDEVVALNANGRPVIRLGKFEGIGPDGAPKGLLFPQARDRRRRHVRDQSGLRSRRRSVTSGGGRHPLDNFAHQSARSLKHPRPRAA